ncbi:hypothetical protein HAX54_015771 [Datura stramonium]|uniref:H(+)-transporting two-sector ATPase n=1 Tax=Datura stramonium TaxID=4076 RepID=A0ABS8UJZ7_DATST|nr:hypothetical protein [Datura stramonium]
MRINPTTSGSGVSTLEKKPGRVVRHRSGTRCSLSPGKMPNIIYNALVVQGRDSVGQPINVACDVQQLLGNNRVRAVAMSATDGLTRGMEVIDTGAPISVPLDTKIIYFETGIKVVDLLAPYRRGGKIGLFRELGGIKSGLVYGQMNEPPGARMRVGLTALTMAEYFRDVNEQDGYQPTLSTEMGSLQEELLLPRRMLLPYYQEDWLPKVFIQPLDPLDSTMLQPRIVGEEHYETAKRVKQTLQRYKELQDIIAILGLDELSEEDRLLVQEREKLSVSYHNPFS